MAICITDKQKLKRRHCEERSDVAICMTDKYRLVGQIATPMCAPDRNDAVLVCAL